jgi:hypothetical protein
MNLMKTPDILQAIQPVTAAFEKLSIPYYIGGSIASSIYGIARATMDVDMVVDMQAHHISALKQLLEKEYYIDENMMKQAAKNVSSFNLIHLKTMIKIDVFFHKADTYARQAISRKRKDTIEEDSSALEFYFSSPEDIIISKLQWYEMGNRTSERQWLDILGVMKVQGTHLDKKYLQYWCAELNILALLESACHDADINLT